MKPKYTVCLEISTRAVKLMMVSRVSRNRLHVDFAYRMPYASKPELGDVVQKVIAECPEQPEFVCTSVWSPTMISKKITMPLMTRKELGIKIKEEAGKNLPFSLEECVYDFYEVLEDIDHEKIEVVLVAAKKDLIVERCEFLDKLGISLYFVDIHPSTLSNLYHTFHDKSPEPVMLVHLGDAPPTIKGEENFACVVKKGLPHMFRDLGDKLSADEIGEEHYTHIVTQIKNAVMYYENASKEKITAVRMSGDKTLCGKISELFLAGSETKIPVEHWSVAAELEYESNELTKFVAENESSFIPCLGMAARKLLS